MPASCAFTSARHLTQPLDDGRWRGRAVDRGALEIAAPGTVLNLASCHEREGMTASAMAECDGRDDRVAFADEHMKALERRLSMLIIVVPPEADRPDLSITRDGIVFGRAAWGTRIPVDPNTHVIEASAPGKVRRRVEVGRGGDGDVQTATLSVLEDVPPVPPPPVVAPQQPVVAPTPRAGLSSRQIAALTTGAAGRHRARAGYLLRADRHREAQRSERDVHDEPLPDGRRPETVRPGSTRTRPR